MKVSRTHLGLLYLSTLLFSVPMLREAIRERRWVWALLAGSNVLVYGSHLLWLLLKGKPSHTTRP